MADVERARAAILKAVSRLVNRVGYESEVYADLTEALAALKDKEVAAAPVVEVATPPPPAETEPAPDAEVQKAEPPPTKTRKRMGRGK